MASKIVSRREFLFGAGAVSLGAVLAACAPATAEPTEMPEDEPEEMPEDEVPGPGLEGTLTTYWAGWTPTEDMTLSEDNPLPHDNLIEVLDEYMAENPGVEVEWIRVPQGVSGREWQIAQQSAGTIPHITSAPHWHIKEDLDKDWWVELTPFYDLPNRYIAEGKAGHDRWLDQFFPIPMGDSEMRGGFYNVVCGMVTTFFYYNVDWFDDMGLEEPVSYSDFLDVCKAFKEEGVNAYGGQTYDPSDTDHWYRLQLGGMIMARDIEEQVNPDRGTATREEVACAIETGVYYPGLPQYKQWMELWKLNVPYRTPDWTTIPTDSHSLFLQKVEPIMENGTWSLARLKTDPLVDFEWSAFFAPTLTDKLSEFVTDPPTTAWPIGGPVSDMFGIPTRADDDGLLEEAVDLMMWMTVPENVDRVQGEIGTAIPMIRDVPVQPEFQTSYDRLTSKIGEQQMFVYEQVKMDFEAAEEVGQAWWAYLLDEMELDAAIAEIEVVFDEYADRFIEEEGLEC